MTMLAAMGLIAAVAVGGTLAYLTDQTNEVTNTFAMGAGIELEIYEDEVDKNEDDDYMPGDGDDENDTQDEVDGNDYENITPGAILHKNPTARLKEGATLARVFMSVQGLDAMKSQGFTVYGTNASDEEVARISTNWKKVADLKVVTDATTGEQALGTVDKEKLDGIYIYVGESTAVEAPGATVKSLDKEPLFTKIVAPSQKQFENLYDNLESGEYVTVQNIKVFSAAVQHYEGQTDEQALLEVIENLRSFSASAE